MSQAEVVLHVAPDYIKALYRKTPGSSWDEVSSIPVTVRCQAASLGDSLQTLLEVPAVKEIFQGANVVVLISDHWLPHCVVPWSLQYLSRERQQALARDQMNAQGYEVNVNDRILVDDAAWGAPRAAIGFPKPLIAEIERFRASAQLRRLVLIPLTAAAATGLAKDSAQRPMVLVESCAGEAVSRSDVTLVQVTQGRIGEVVARTFPTVENTEIAGFSDALIGRLGWSQGGDANLSSSPGTLERFSLAEFLIGGGWSVKARTSALALVLDAQPARLRMHPIESILAAAFVVASIGLLAMASRQSAEAQGLLQARAASQARNTRAETPQASKEELLRLGALNRTIRGLNFQMSAALDRLVPPRDIDVGVIALEVMPAPDKESQPRTLKVQAEAPTFDDMTHYVGFLGSQKPCTRSTLIRHEIVQAAAALPTYRFAVDVECGL